MQLCYAVKYRHAQFLKVIINQFLIVVENKVKYGTFSCYLFSILKIRD